MGFFDTIFGSKKEDLNKEEKRVPWVSLNSLEQLEALGQKSKTRPQIVFKHSTTCGISRMALNMFEKNPALQYDSLDLYFLDLRQHREVSNEIAQKFQVLHQSPQLLIIKNGQTVAHASHGGVAELKLEDYL